MNFEGLEKYSRVLCAVLSWPSPNHRHLMKSILASLFTLAFAPALLADVGVYNGSASIKTTSSDLDIQLLNTGLSKVTVIVDLNTGESQSIAVVKKTFPFGLGTIKQFTVSPALATKLQRITD